MIFAVVILFLLLAVILHPVFWCWAIHQRFRKPTGRWVLKEFGTYYVLYKECKCFRCGRIYLDDGNPQIW